MHIQSLVDVIDNRPKLHSIIDQMYYRCYEMGDRVESIDDIALLIELGGDVADVDFIIADICKLPDVMSDEACQLIMQIDDYDFYRPCMYSDTVHRKLAAYLHDHDPNRYDKLFHAIYARALINGHTATIKMIKNTRKITVPTSVLGAIKSHPYQKSLLIDLRSRYKIKTFRTSSFNNRFHEAITHGIK